jgi:hypothetical protein
MFKRFLIGLVGLIALGMVGIAVLSWRSAIAPIATPSVSGFSP